MMKSIKAIFAQDREAYRIPRRVQDTIPIKRVWPDGIFLVGNKYSMSFRFTDINYLIASREDKERMFLTYSELLNSLDSGATTKITLNNHRLNRRDFEASIVLVCALAKAIYPIITGEVPTTANFAAPMILAVVECILEFVTRGKD